MNPFMVCPISRASVWQAEQLLASELSTAVWDTLAIKGMMACSSGKDSLI